MLLNFLALLVQLLTIKCIAHIFLVLLIYTILHNTGKNEYKKKTEKAIKVNMYFTCTSYYKSRYKVEDYLF